MLPTQRSLIRLTMLLLLPWLVIISARANGNLTNTSEPAQQQNVNYGQLSRKEQFELLFHAVSYGDRELAEQLISSGADVNYYDARNDYPLLIQAAIMGQLEMAKILIAAGANLDAKDRDGDTASIQAARRGRVDMLKLLVKGRRDIAVLKYASQQCQTDIIEDLLAAGIDPNIKDRRNQTALMAAVKAGCTDTVRVLLAAGASVKPSGQNNYQHNPLKEAILLGQADVVRLLLAAGADANIGTVKGVSLLEFAKAQVYDTIAELLESAGAKSSHRATPTNVKLSQPQDLWHRSN